MRKQQTVQVPVLDPLKIKKDFPILSRSIRGKPLLYLDSAATAQKPQVVINAVKHFYEETNANVHRGVYLLSQEATDLYEGVRVKICDYLGRKKTEEIIFTSGTTDAVNLVATALERGSIGSYAHIGPGDDIIVTRMEHHANFVPWQQLAKAKNANFKIVELTADGRVDLDQFEKVLKSGKPKIVAFTMMSNVLGTVNPVREMALMAKNAGAMVFVDAAQGVVHLNFHISDLGPIDFLAFSSHKVCGPSGVGVMWAREEILWGMRPFRYGGDMIRKVDDFETTWNDLPWKFEAGTPPMEAVVGLGAALDYLMSIGRDAISAHEKDIAQYALKKLSAIEGLKIVGPQTVENRGAVISMLVDGVHPHDLATLLDLEGIAMRAGHHCAQPLMKHLNVAATNRASFYIYNHKGEVDKLCAAIEGAKEYFKPKAKKQPSGVLHGR